MFVGRPGAYPRMELLKVFVPAKPFQPSLEMLTRDKHSSLLRKSTNTSVICFTVQAPEWKWKALRNTLAYDTAASITAVKIIMLPAS
jgi:hypothetical protein